MSEEELKLTTKKPKSPDSDIAFYIDYKKGAGSASRVFAATHDFIKACEYIDKELLQAIDSNIEPVMTLEDIEAASLKTRIKNILTATDDQALKKLDWKPAVGKYLVQAKYAILRWLDDEDGDLVKLCQEIKTEAINTDVKYLPDYKSPNPNTLLNAVRKFQGVKDHLIDGDIAKVISNDEEYEMNLSMRWDIDSLEQLAVKETIVSPPAIMILAVKKPDYLGDSKWELRHGNKNVPTKINHTDWLNKFQNREIEVRPGDTLKCRVITEHLYGHDNELISEKYTAVEIIEVLTNDYDTQQELFTNENQ